MGRHAAHRGEMLSSEYFQHLRTYRNSCVNVIVYCCLITCSTVDIGHLLLGFKRFNRSRNKKYRKHASWDLRFFSMCVNNEQTYSQLILQLQRAKSCSLFVLARNRQKSDATSYWTSQLKSKSAWNCIYQLCSEWC